MKRKKKAKAGKKRTKKAVEGPPNPTYTQLQFGELSADLGAKVAPEEKSPERPFEDAGRAMDGEEKKPGSHPTPQGAAPIDVAQGMVGVVDVIVSQSVAMTARRLKVKSSPELRELQHLSREEKDTLGIFAPMAAPLFQSSLQNLPWIGAAGFGLILVLTLADRTRALKELAGKAEGRAEERAAKVDDENAHKAKWGGAADAVPQGFEPKDTGFGARFTPGKEDDASISGPVPLHAL